jgi:hypothetical protein
LFLVAISKQFGIKIKGDLKEFKDPPRHTKKILTNIADIYYDNDKNVSKLLTYVKSPVNKERGSILVANQASGIGKSRFLYQSAKECFSENILAINTTFNDTTPIEGVIDAESAKLEYAIRLIYW